MKLVHPDTGEILLQLPDDPSLDDLLDIKILLKRIDWQIKDITKKVDNDLQDCMMDDEYEVGDYLVKRKYGYTAQRFDSKSFKEDDPDLYSRYIKETHVKDSILVSLIKK